MKNILFLVSGILACIIILSTIFVVSKHITKSPLIHISVPNQVENIAYVTPTPPGPTEGCAQFPLATGCGVAGTAINICTKQYPFYPPLLDILTTPANPNLGVYEGTISKLDIAGKLNESVQSITVTSDRSGKSFTFNGGSVNGYTYDIHHSVVKFFYTLHTGMKAVVSFPCSQKLGIFTLNQFQLVQ